MWLRSVPSSAAPIASSALRERSLSESVLNSTRSAPSVLKAWASMSSFASVFTGPRCHGGAIQV